MSEPQPPPVDLKQIGALAKRFTERQMFEEAAELLTFALRFEPKNRAFQLGLADVRKRQKQAQGRRERSAEEALREQVRRDTIDAAHFLGLATLYEQRGKREQAFECLEIARSKDVINPALHKLRGRILFQRQEFDEAVEELRTAARYNPFDREVFELLGRAEYERESYLDALQADVDAFLLLDDDDRENAERLKKRIRMLKTLRKISSQDLVELFRERREKLQTAFDRLDWQRKSTLQTPSSETGAPDARPKGDQLAMAGRLRRLGVLAELEDDQIFQLAQTVRSEQLERAAKIFEHGSRGTEIYVVEHGRIAIRRPTHYGTIDLGVLEAGSLFGELAFITRYERSGDAVAAEDSVVLAIDPEALEALINEQPLLGVQLYQVFWRGLARKLRASNEQLKTFFAGGTIPQKLLELRAGARPEGGQVEIQPDDKIRLFREQGLTGDELTTLANFSSVKRFPGGTYLFHEGDEGKTMYVVLEGKVMISKYLPGGGEEALAILPRGDFFGEMSLIDGEPRSADAKAMGGPVTVVELDETTLKEVMALDPQAALDFMKLLCRLIAKRLREIDEKLTSWSIFDGGRAEGQAIEWETPAQSRTA